MPVRCLVLADTSAGFRHRDGVRPRAASARPRGGLPRRGSGCRACPGCSPRASPPCADRETEKQVVGNFSARLPGGHQAQHLELAACQSGRVGPRRGVHRAGWPLHRLRAGAVRPEPPPAPRAQLLKTPGVPGALRLRRRRHTRALLHRVRQAPASEAPRTARRPLFRRRRARQVAATRRRVHRNATAIVRARRCTRRSSCALRELIARGGFSARSVEVAFEPCRLRPRRAHWSTSLQFGRLDRQFERFVEYCVDARLAAQWPHQARPTATSA